MTIGEARMPDGGVIPTKSIDDDLQTATVVETVVNIKFDEPTIRTEIKNRFARLKKSLRKRSVSIL